jgi:hypothetical protein
MALSSEAYKALEEAVGPDFISDDPALCDTYIYPLTQMAIHLGPYYGVFTPRPAAVLLPGSTEDVQKIVRVCNKYKIKFKASATFWSARANISDKDAIALDMRRMDRILEIDAKNQFAVIEPYVIGTTLQAEAMKVGLNTHLIGAGASCSPLAAATSCSGFGPDTIFMGSAHENLLAAEWVTPDGEILRTGSLGSGIGWFSGDGPGFGARGILRGQNGAMGAMGVFTKCAIKLYPWSGPADFPTEGIIPAYKAVLPETVRAHTLAWPSWEAFADGCHMIWDGEIGYIAHRQFCMFGRDLKGAMIRILTDPTKTLSDLEELLKDPQVQKETEEMKREFQIVLVGMTARNIEYQEKVLDKILADTGGWKAPLTEDPDINRWMALYMIRLGHKNLNVAYGGGYDGCNGLVGIPDFSCPKVEEATEFKAKWEREKDTIVAAGGDCMMGGMANIGGGGITGWENFTNFDPYSKESAEGTFKFFEATYKYGLEKGWGAGMERENANLRGPDGFGLSKEEQERMVAGVNHAVKFNYQWKIREALNPNHLGDSYYITLEPKK